MAWYDFFKKNFTSKGLYGQEQDMFRRLNSNGSMISPGPKQATAPMRKYGTEAENVAALNRSSGTSLFGVQGPETDLKLSDAYKRPYLGAGPLIFPEKSTYDPTKIVPGSDAGDTAGTASGSTTTGSGTGKGTGNGGSGVTSSVTSVGIGAIPSPTIKPEADKPTPPLMMGTTGVVPSSDFVKAQENVGAMSEFYGRTYQGMTELQNEYNTTRAGQKTNVDDQKAANLETGYDDARNRYLDVQRRVQEFNAIVNTIENDVRRDYGPEATESYIQAEIKRRTNAMEPQANRLNAELAAAQTDMTVFRDEAIRRYDASRADAEEKVAQVAQKLGFQNANLSMASNLFNQVKNYEVTIDAQKNAERDSWRALANTLVTNPALLYQASNQDLVNIASMAQMPTESLTSLKKVFSQGTVANVQLGDDGALGYAVVRPDGTWVFGKQVDYAKVIKTTGSSSALTGLQSPVNMSAPFRAAYVSVLEGIKDPNLTNEERATLVFQAVAYLDKVAVETLNAGQKADPNYRNDADFAMAKALKAKILGQAVTSTDDLAAAFSAIVGQ